jgi:hypothetical protein
MSRSLPRSPLVPAVAGAVALVVAVFLGYLTVRDVTGPEPASADATPTAPGAAEVATDRVYSEAAGFAVAVPRDLEATRAGRTVRLVSHAKDLVVVVGPAGPGSLARAERRLLARMKDGYPEVSVLGTQAVEVDGYPAQTVFGNAVNDADTRLRFAVVTVHAGNRNYTVASYAAYDADPAEVLPRVNAVANGFEVLEPGS